jgi:hypothetical protein
LSGVETIFEILCESARRKLRRFGVLGFVASLLLAFYVELPLELGALQSGLKRIDRTMLQAIRLHLAGAHTAERRAHGPDSPGSKG